MKKNKKKAIIRTLLSAGIASSGVAAPLFTTFNPTTNVSLNNMVLTDGEMNTILALKEDAEAFKGTFNSVIDYQQDITNRVTSPTGEPVRSSFTVGWTDLIHRSSGISSENSNNFWGVQIPHILGESLINIEKETVSKVFINPKTGESETRFVDEFYQTNPLGTVSNDFSLPYEIKFSDDVEKMNEGAPSAAENYLLTILAAALNSEDSNSMLADVLGGLMQYIIPTITMGTESYVSLSPNQIHWEDILTNPGGFISSLFTSNYEKMIKHGISKPPGDMIADFLVKDGLKDAIRTGKRDLLRLPIALFGEAIMKTLFSLTDNEYAWVAMEEYSDYLPANFSILDPTYDMQYSDYLDEEQTLKTLHYYRKRDQYVKQFKVTGLTLKVNMVEQGNVVSNRMVGSKFTNSGSEEVKGLEELYGGDVPIIGGNLISNYRLFYKNIEINWDYEIVATKDRFNPDKPETWYEGIDDYEPL